MKSFIQQKNKCKISVNVQGGCAYGKISKSEKKMVKIQNRYFKNVNKDI